MPLWSSVLLALLSLVVLVFAIAAHLRARRRSARSLYQRRLEDALVPIMAGVIRMTGWMQAGA